MSPDGGGRWRSVDPPETVAEARPLPLDVALEGVAVQLRAAGARARLAGQGSTQPTRFFAQQLRGRLVAALGGDVPAGPAFGGPADGGAADDQLRE